MMYRPTLEDLEPRKLLTTYYVSPAGSDASAGTSDAGAFATLQKAANSVTAGDTVIVRAGTYPAGFVMGWDSNPTGTPTAPIAFLADPGAVITGRNARTADGIDLEPDTNYVIIQGFTVNNAAGTITRAGIRIVGSHHVTVRGNTADHNGTWGIFTGFADDLLIENNVCSNSQTQHGIYVSNSGDRPVIRGNVCFGNQDNGIHMNGDLSQELDGYVTDGLISGALVENNVLYDNGLGGGSGINCDGVINSTIRNNLIYNTHSSGISLYMQDGATGSTGNLVANNTVLVASNGRWAMNIQNGSTGNTLLNNVFYNAHPSRGAIDISSDSRPGFVSDYNAVLNRFTTNGGSSNITLATWRTQTGQDAHSILISNPATFFVNPAANDYRLKLASPAIDAGAAALNGRSAPPADLAGFGRPQGVTFDIGAYEAPVPGDANLNGRIDFDDYVLLDRGFAKHLTGYSNGDFNYDNVIDAADYAILDASFAQQSHAPVAVATLVERRAEFGGKYVKALKVTSKALAAQARHHAAGYFHGPR